MGVLDDLKREAERVRAQDEDERARRAGQEAFYRSDLKPAMLRIVNYLVELLNQLKVIQPEIRGQFQVPGCKTPVPALQSLPVLTLDSRDDITRASLRMEYGIDNLRFSVTPRPEAEEARAFLMEAGQEFSDWPVRAPGDEIIGLSFAIDRFRLPALLDIAADVEQGRLVFTSIDIRSFHHEKDFVTPDSVTGEWLDRLGLYLLGQGPTPVRLQLAEEARVELQRKVAQDRAQRERELAEAERLLREQEEAAKLHNRVRRLLGSVKDKLPRRPGR